jgi:ATP-dependent Clp protease protease subunit
VRAALEALPADDKQIDLVFNCRGGNCIDGWAIYDLLRQQDGCTITSLIEGECSSMASVILLAAAKENRKAYPNAHLCIHNPAFMWLNTDWYERLTADALDATADKIKAQADLLRTEQQHILDVYVERTGSNAEELQALMDKDIYVDMQQAQALGFINEILPPLTAKKSNAPAGASINPINKTTKAMSKTSDKATRFGKVVEALKELIGLSDEPKMVCLEVTAADGSVLSVEREEGEPQVGDAASPDGTFVMEDGTEIVVEGGVITAINAPEPEESATTEETPAAEGEETPAEGEPDETEELRNRVAELEAELEKANNRIAELEAELEKANNAEDKRVLEIVAKAGGIEAVEKAINARSTFNAGNTKRVEKPAAKGEQPVTFGDDFIEERRKAYDAARAKMR